MLRNCDHARCSEIPRLIAVIIVLHIGTGTSERGVEAGIYCLFICN